jgi:DNA replicative helicase MCM subunit Mcm2 (Cdc46/Mcm family)
MIGKTLHVEEIKAEHLNKPVVVKGEIVNMGKKHAVPKIIAWQCRACGNIYKIEQESFYIKRKPAFCECRHRRFVPVPEKSEFIDIQEMRLMSLNRNNFRELTVVLTMDSINKFRKKQQVKVAGAIKIRQNRKNKFDLYLEAAATEVI